MNKESPKQRRPQYTPETWKEDEDSFATTALPASHPQSNNPTVQDQCRLLDLLGKINYKILSGNRVYVEVGGVVYKTVYGGYWRSVFTGIEHYLLRCEQVSNGAWTEDDCTAIDLPIAYSNNCWTASGHSLSFMLNRD